MYYIMDHSIIWNVNKEMSTSLKVKSTIVTLCRKYKYCNRYIVIENFKTFQN